MPLNESLESGWQDQMYDLLRKGGVTIFSYVPDAGHKTAIERAIADADVTAVPLTSEQEGVALGAGAHLGGAKAVLLMQSSGAGNCINMLSLIENGRFPFLAIVTMRGDFGEANPWQYAMGQAVQPTLEAMGVICLRAETAADVVPVTTAALSMAFQAERPVAILLSQRLIGAKPF
jgi:sulfopyruvate decarboxylase alpha subunit